MDRCSPKKAPPEKSVSDSQRSREKKMRIPSWLTGQSPSALEKKPTDISESKDEAGTSHHKDTEHDIPQWRLKPKRQHDFYQPQEVKELISKINNELKGFREDLKICKLPFEMQTIVTIATKEIDPQIAKIYNIQESIYLSRKIMKEASTGQKNTTNELSELDKNRENMQKDLEVWLQYTYHKIQNMRNELSKLHKALENIEKLQKVLETGSLPKDQRELINKHFTDEIQEFNISSVDTTWTTHWASLVETIEDLGNLINAHNNKHGKRRDTPQT